MMSQLGALNSFSSFVPGYAMLGMCAMYVVSSSLRVHLDSNINNVAKDYIII